uniref:Cytochrome c oxidase subunit 3 n=1 Tax=Euryades corethrus TaxID=95568 RepID=A0A2U3PPB9_9NEOP|nr:cytochrome c oxidase subunit III [Euryades corethrus]SPP23412.1 cytochrome c oxidase subunit III [Euryades corethrus]
MSMNNTHPFHLVDYSPWPLTSSIGIMTLMTGMIKWFYNYNMNLMILGYFIILLTMYQWWRDICRESTFQGKHTILVSKGLRWGMILFIISEVFFFISFFWTFFHSSLSPNIEIGIMWPPLSIVTFNPFQIPLLNTIILISSGITITWAHHAIMENNFSQMTQGLFITIMLGIYFSILQTYEYFEAPFSIADSIYGSIFFMMTGFHGLHVIIGTTFLFICLLRHLKFHFSMNHHFGFEAATWYWHFVDVIWLLLYISVYWWGN